MNLPIINQLLNDESTYIAFTKGLLDLDEAMINGTEYYFSKIVALNLPNWEEGKFYYNLQEELNLSDNPNIVIPKMIQHYMENIMRQDNEYITDEDQPINEITELAFYKTLNKLGMSKEAIRKSVVFCNDIVTSTFTKIENNNGWGEIVCQIPNKCRVFTPAWRTVNNIHDIVSTQDEYNDTTDSKEQKPLYDDDNNHTYLMENFKDVLDINNSKYDDVEKSEFSFNVLLLFYRDKSGVDKLHGINFIYPFEDKVSYWDQIRFTQKTNVANNIGYQFVFNLKTCNNEASLIKVCEHNKEAIWWNGFSKTLGCLNSFLEIKMREQRTEKISTIPHIQGD